ncbi:uncharacterized protein B0I36DRAFT_331602 [Microdochium trichocladiopsis]|uniref:GPI anchored protein n=1 Tax=Microdochium trichocladiopsis TaxID=1682393 RepID=A0A9P8XXB0_9PEZI|nr:uncharacterized protein B0I36DRAFT_331602 [Microdochium trichocladiopsis]KAH7024541.1 hypothetical protein B0I36DRAFT_331602 [Microdochium trichocladiopsis]
MYTSNLLTSAALATAVSAVTQFTTTATVPGLTLTLPVGVGTSTTSTIKPHTVTGTGAVISGVTVIVDSSSVYFIDGNNFEYGAASGTNDFNGITVINGMIPGATATGTASSPSGSGSMSMTSSGTSAVVITTGSTTVTTTNSMGSTVTSTGAVTSTSRPNAGERAFGSAQMFGWAGVAVGAAAVANC